MNFMPTIFVWWIKSKKQVQIKQMPSIFVMIKYGSIVSRGTTTMGA